MRHIKFKLFVNFARFKNMCCPCKEIDENSKSKHCKQFKDTSESLQPKTEEISCCSVARWIAIRSLLHYSGYSTVRCCHFKTTWMKKKKWHLKIWVIEIDLYDGFNSGFESLTHLQTSTVFTTFMFEIPKFDWITIYWLETYHRMLSLQFNFIYKELQRHHCSSSQKQNREVTCSVVRWRD